MIALLAAAVPAVSHAQDYQAQKLTVDGVEIVRLTDAKNAVEVSILPSAGNLAYEMKVHGKNIFWIPSANPVQIKARPTFAGNPFLAPFANRLDQWGFYANGKHYLLNRELGSVRPDQHGNPMHGAVTYSQRWVVRDVQSSSNQGAVVTSRLEYWRYPELMAQFPFAHTIEMTYRLLNGVLECETRVENLSSDPMPVAVGYHPYFRVYDAPRDEWTVQLPAQQQMVLSDKLIPTGELKPNPYASPVSLKGVALDDVFTGLVRDAQGKAEFSVKGKDEKVSVVYGPKYPVAVIYAPAGRGFICFEPMSAPTNAFNAAQAGTYKELQTIPPGGEWKESFWVKPEGFKP